MNWESQKVLLPILGRPYGEALESQELVLRPWRTAARYSSITNNTAHRRRCREHEGLIRSSHASTIVWRIGARPPTASTIAGFSTLAILSRSTIRARRCISRNPSIRPETRRRGKVTGLRIDHIDGLLDPKGYLDRLPKAYVVTEKILAGNEHLRCDWRTTGPLATIS